jgi:hypothetical protein
MRALYHTALLISQEGKARQNGNRDDHDGFKSLAVMRAGTAMQGDNVRDRREALRGGLNSSLLTHFPVSESRSSAEPLCLAGVEREWKWVLERGQALMNTEDVSGESPKGHTQPGHS